MQSAETGNRVKVHYTGKLDDGNVFDSSVERSPIEFTIGQGELIKDFEEAVVGMSVGDKKTVNIPASDAYGEHRSELVVNFDKSQFPEHIQPELGMTLDLKSPEGKIIKAVITDMEESTVTLDANHPLAGRDLTFDIELMEIA